jgi:hypothetical protein
MDVDSLKAELEEHLAKNPDEHAPHGFRDRFDSIAEQYKCEGCEVPKAVWEGELQRVRDDAEAAWRAADGSGADAPPPRAEAPQPRAEAVEAPSAPPAPVERSDPPRLDPVDPPPPGFLQRYGVALAVAAVVLIGAWYFFRR